MTDRLGYRLQTKTKQTKTTNTEELEFYLKQTLNSKKPKHKAYLNSVLDDYESGVVRADTEANATDRALSGQLILITTVLITVNIVVMGDKESLNSLIPVQKVLLSLGLLLLTSSLWLGIEYYDEVKKFHKKWAAGRNAVTDEVENFRIGTYGDLRKIIDDNIRSRLRPSIDEKYLRRQIKTLRYALVIYLILATTLLFDLSFITNYITSLFIWCK